MQDIVKEVEYYLYNYIYNKFNIQLAGFKLDVTKKGKELFITLALPRFLEDGGIMELKVSLKKLSEMLNNGEDYREVIYQVILQTMKDMEEEEYNSEG